MKRLLAVAFAAFTLLGCRSNGQATDPFFGRTTIEPPPTGAGQSEPYYQPTNPAGAQATSHLRRVRLATQRMGELIDDLLGLSRLTRQEIYLETVDLSALAGSVAQSLLQNEPHRHVDFAVAEGARTQGDRSLLEVVLQNLLANAWKFTSRQPNARIEFGIHEKDGKPVFFVRDNGAGFDMAYAGKLFGAFQRLHTQDEFQGHGIGLAIVHRVIRRHGGRSGRKARLERERHFHSPCEGGSSGQ